MQYKYKIRQNLVTYNIKHTGHFVTVARKDGYKCEQFNEQTNVGWCPNTSTLHLFNHINMKPRIAS